jgi:hypothetical protein
MINDKTKINQPVAQSKSIFKFLKKNCTLFTDREKETVVQTNPALCITVESS